MKHVERKSIFRVVCGSATQQEKDLVLKHIEACTECMGHYRSMASLESMFRASSDIPAPENSYSIILDSISNPKKRFSGKFSYILNGLFIFLVLTVGAASFFAGSRIGSGMLASKTSSISSMLADAAADEYPSGSVAEAIMSLNK